MEAVPTVYNRKLNKRIREYSNLGYKPIFNWCSPIMRNQFNMDSGDFQVIHYAMVKDTIVEEKVWQVYKSGKIVEFTK